MVTTKDDCQVVHLYPAGKMTESNEDRASLAERKEQRLMPFDMVADTLPEISDKGGSRETHIEEKMDARTAVISATVCISSVST